VEEKDILILKSYSVKVTLISQTVYMTWQSHWDNTEATTFPSTGRTL